MDRLTYYNEEYGCWTYKCASGDAAKRLKEYEDTGLSPQEIKNQQWSFTIEPPKTSGAYLVGYLDDWFYISIAFYEPFYDQWTNHSQIVHPIFWMNLPKPPKEEPYAYN